MKRYVMLVVAGMLMGTHAFAASSDDDEVIATLQSFLDGMAKRDATMIKAPILPGTVHIGLRQGKISRTEIDALAENMSKPKPTTFLEKMKNPVVHIDTDVAVAFVPFNTYIDGKLHHCGTNVFTLAKTEGRWVISAVSDTLHYEGCKE